MVVGAAGTVERQEDLPRRRARCKEPDCPCGSWTIYEAGGYPRRSFTLAVAAAAIAELTFAASATLTSVAGHWRCDRRTVARWQRWVAGTAEPATLAQLCSRLDPDGLPAPDPEGIARPGRVLLLLECLARLLQIQGVALEPGPGLGAILAPPVRAVPSGVLADPDLPGVARCWGPGRGLNREHAQSSERSARNRRFPAPSHRRRH